MSHYFSEIFFILSTFEYNTLLLDYTYFEIYWSVNLNIITTYKILNQLIVFFFQNLQLFFDVLHTVHYDTVLTKIVCVLQ